MEELPTSQTGETHKEETKTGPTCWRKSPVWNEETFESLKTDIRKFVPPPCRDIQHVNILLIGPVGAGKSSFFNTISSVFKERLSSQAYCGSAEKSITTTFRTYRVRDKTTKSNLAFRLCDTRGLEEGEQLDDRELNLVLNGNIFDGYKHGSVQAAENRKKALWYKTLAYLLPRFFPPEPVIPGYRKSSTFDSEIHCVCFVLDASTASVLSDRTVEKIKTVQRIARNRAIPQVFLMTKMDKVCPLVDADVSAIFQSPVVKDVVENMAQLFGVPRSHVLPLKNYENEADVSMEISILALLSLKFMLSCAEDFLFDIMDRNDDTTCSDAWD